MKRKEVKEKKREYKGKKAISMELSEDSAQAILLENRKEHQINIDRQTYKNPYII